MTIEISAALAARSGTLDPPTDVIDAALYIAFYSLYVAFYNKQITHEQAKQTKTRLYRNYNELRRDFDFKIKCFTHSHKIYDRVSEAAINYRLSRTLENADKLLDALYKTGG